MLLLYNSGCLEEGHSASCEAHASGARAPPTTTDVNYVGLWRTPASRRKFMIAVGRVQRCSIVSMLCESLCTCVFGQCRRTCSVPADPAPQFGQESSGASPILCAYVGTSVL